MSKDEEITLEALTRAGDVVQTFYALAYQIICPKCHSSRQVWLRKDRWVCRRVGCDGNGGLDLPFDALDLHRELGFKLDETST